MRKISFCIIALAFLGACQPGIHSDKDNAGLKLPEGFSALIFADDIGHARHIDINSNGDVYISLSRVKNGGGWFVCVIKIMMAKLMLLNIMVFMTEQE